MDQLALLQSKKGFLFRCVPVRETGASAYGHDERETALYPTHNHLTQLLCLRSMHDVFSYPSTQLALNANKILHGKFKVKQKRWS
jgi:hypothetical protein